MRIDSYRHREPELSSGVAIPWLVHISSGLLRRRLTPPRNDLLMCVYSTAKKLRIKF